MHVQESFRIGVFSSASPRTVSSVLPMLEAAAAQGYSGVPPLLLPEKVQPVFPGFGCHDQA